MKAQTKFHEITLEHHVASNENWVCQLDGDEDVPLALYIEVVNMKEATGEPEFNDYPYLASVSIVALNPHPSFYEGDGEPDQFGLIFDAVSYMGGVPVDDKLLSLDASNKNITMELKARMAKLVTRTNDYGTVAARELEALLENNAGYNPERASDHGEYHLSKNKTVLMVGDHAFTLTDATSMHDYVSRFPKRFGLTIGNSFYTEDEI